MIVDFVLWTMKGLHIERIEPDADVFAEIIAKSRVLPDRGVTRTCREILHSFESPASV